MRRSRTAAVLIETLSAPASSSARTSSTVRTPPPTVTGMKQCSAVRRDDVEDGAAVLVAGGDVEEAELVGAGRVIGARRLDRIAGVGEVDEADALDDAAVLHVEAGDDADLEHHAASRASDQRQRLGRVEPAVVERAAGDGAFEDRRSRAASRRSMSASEARPPEAITGIDTASASAERRVDVEALEHAVAVDVGVDDRGDAGVLEAAGEVDGVDLGGFGPALHRDLAAARVDADGDAAGIARARRRARAPGSRTATVPRMTRRDALVEPGLDRRACRGCRRRAAPGWSTAARIASTAAPLTERPAKAPLRSTTCSHSKPCAGEGARLRGGVGVEARGARHVALLEAHAVRRPSGRWRGRGSSRLISTRRTQASAIALTKEMMTAAATQ